MGGKKSSRWPKGYKREPSVEETWALDCSQFSKFFINQKRIQSGEIQVISH
jgi:hypothetical protein